MHKMFSLKTIVATLIGTSITGGLIALPVRANENNLVKPTNFDLILSQIEEENRPYDNEPSNSLKNIIGLTGLAIGTGVIGYQVSKAYKLSLANPLPTLNDNSNVSLLTRISPKLRRELLRLVHNQQIADRLMKGTSFSHPGRSPNWIAEKVIYDLKRDR